jgi:5-formyltetrahydrofolate cyclo-ligase
LSNTDDRGHFASAPCLLPELENDWEQVKAWRAGRRQGLVRHRSAADPQQRQNLNREIVGRLAEIIHPGVYPTLGFYWPIRGEVDIRDLARSHVAAGGQAALPVIVTRHAPVEFWKWHPGMPTTRGVLDIPTPRERHPLVPDVLVIPLIGFDRAQFRLGYGGGYYDRTLAAMRPRPLAIGIASAEAQLETIYPQPHDIPMDVIITEQFVLGAERLRR